MRKKITGCKTVKSTRNRGWNRKSRKDYPNLKWRLDNMWWHWGKLWFSIHFHELRCETKTLKKTAGMNEGTEHKGTSGDTDYICMRHCGDRWKQSGDAWVSWYKRTMKISRLFIEFDIRALTHGVSSLTCGSWWHGWTPMFSVHWSFP